MVTMVCRLLLPALLLFPLLLFPGEAKTLDPYKVLGVDKNASQRDIQKAFHKLSLQYHPDKNKNKGAQEKFAEINNAYEILSDEEKKKNYDLYGDEKGNPGFGGGNFGNHEGYSYFSHAGGRPGSSYFTSDSEGWQTMDGQGNSKTFSFSFGGDSTGSGNPFGFSFGDIFSNIFGGAMKGGSQNSGFSNFGGPNSRSDSPASLKDIKSQFFNKHISDQGMTWLLLFFTPAAKGYQILETIVEDVVSSLDGAIKAGRVNCLTEKALCREAGISSAKSARLFIYSYISSEKGSLVEYTGNHDSKSLKIFCQDHLPRFSKRIDATQFDFPSRTIKDLPQVLLLSTKKDTPVMWRTVSGLYYKKFIFYDAKVHDISHPLLKKLGVKDLPAVVGRTVDGEVQVLRAGIAVKDLKSGINELSSLLESFEKKNKRATSRQAKKSSQSEQSGANVPFLTAENFDYICGEKTAVCIIGVFRSSEAKQKLETVLSAISQKTLVRQQHQDPNSGNSISYALLDASKQSAFLSSFERSGYKSSDKFLVAYKPRRGKFAAFTDEVTMEEAEKFVGSVLNGDIKFSNVRQKPIVR
ncbi:dnaJ protein ERDJ3A [Typha latifolia]|uniref:dnaJ protein ERDJ3A n=1 Tax=Typha latifolia TaxID=4733 RepID=UPI003C2F0A6D